MPADTVMTAMVVNHMYGIPTVQLFPLASVNQARLEHGATLADAKAFVLDTSCLECGYAGCEIRECVSCGDSGCACLVTEGVHGSELFCPDCAQVCGCNGCNDYR